MNRKSKLADTEYLLNPMAQINHELRSFCFRLKK